MDGYRASGRQHQVQDSHADGSLSLLGNEAARSHPRSDQSLLVAGFHTGRTQGLVQNWGSGGNSGWRE